MINCFHRLPSRLQVLSLGGNLLTEVPDSVGNLQQLQALTLCDNLIEILPASIARLANLKSLLLHKNRLRHLPRNIITLKNLVEVSAAAPNAAESIPQLFIFSFRFSFHFVRIRWW